MVAVLVIARLCEPSNEFHIAEQWHRKTALEDIVGAAIEEVNDDRLYRALDALLPHKEAIEQHLKSRLGELFDLDHGLLLYDVTSTYFEGAAAANPQAQRGHSRDHRTERECRWNTKLRWQSHGHHDHGGGCLHRGTAIRKIESGLGGWIAA